MAVVKIGQVKKTLSKAMTYICNPEKTRNMELVSTNLDESVKDPLSFANRFIEQQDRVGTGKNGRGDEILAHHIIQSFDPNDDITAEQAHEIGVRLITELTDGDQYYVIATHVDRDHIHNHIMLSPIQISQDRRMRMQRNTLKNIRNISDRLCRDNGLHVLREPQVNKYGKSRPDLYTQLKGESVKESIRLRIDQSVGRVESFDQFKRTLRSVGVFTHVRGRYLTFEDAQSGMRFRDSKLGQAYDEMSIMSKIGQQSVECISFHESMIAGRDASTVSVWLPGTRRMKRLTIPRVRLVVDGRTIRAWLPRDSEQIISDRQGRYMQQIPTEALYEYFAPPNLNIDKLVPDSFPQIYTANPRQRARLMAQAIKVEEINRLVREIGVVRDYLVEGGMSGKEAIAALSQKIREKQTDFQSLIVASCEEGLTPEQVSVLDKQISGSEQEISDIARQIRALRERDQRLNRPTDDEQRHKPRRNR